MHVNVMNKKVKEQLSLQLWPDTLSQSHSAPPSNKDPTRTHSKTHSPHKSPVLHQVGEKSTFHPITLNLISSFFLFQEREYLFNCFS